MQSSQTTCSCCHTKRGLKIRLEIMDIQLHSMCPVHQGEKVNVQFAKITCDYTTVLLRILLKESAHEHLHPGVPFVCIIHNLCVWSFLGTIQNVQYKPC